MADVLLDTSFPRTLDVLAERYARPGTRLGAPRLDAWVFEDEPMRRAAEARLAAAGVRARLRSAYKPLLHFFLEEVELSGLSAVTVQTPSHPGSTALRFRLEAYPLAGLLRGIPVQFEDGERALEYVVRLRHGDRRTEHRVFAPNRERPTPMGAVALSPCGWLRRWDGDGDAPAADAPLDTEYEQCFAAAMAALAEHEWGEAAPYFDALEIAVETGGIEHRLPYGDECISTREALHEDLYFSALEFFQHRAGRPAGDRLLRPGQIVPDIRPGAGPTRLRIALRPGDGTATRQDGTQPLAEADRPLDPAQIERELRALGGATFAATTRQGRTVHGAHFDGAGPGLVVTAGQHANETSGVVGALRAAPALRARGLRFALVPQENPDGYALHGLLRGPHPRHIHHAARFTALGDDLEYREAEPFHETAARQEAFRRTDARLHVNLHGYPAHEWTRPHTGYTPARYELWSIPKGFFLILRHHPGGAAAAEGFVRTLATRLAASVPGLRAYNQAQLATYAAHAGPVPFPVHDDIPCQVMEHARGVPPFTLITEYPDETIYGDAFRLAHEAQMAAVLLAADLLAEGALPPPLAAP